MRAVGGGVRAFCIPSGATLFTIVGLIGGIGQACAQPLPTALIQAYQNNPQLNAQRAQVRVTDEAVPQALSGYRPRVSVTASVGESYSSSTQVGTTTVPGSNRTQFLDNQERVTSGEFTPKSVGVTG